jgi:hypothetical protein
MSLSTCYLAISVERLHNYLLETLGRQAPSDLGLVSGIALQPDQFWRLFGEAPGLLLLSERAGPRAWYKIC